MRLIDVCDINPRAQAIDDNLEVSFVAMPDVSEDGKINTGNIRSYCEVKKGFTCFQEGDVLFAKITPCMENGKGALAVGLKNGIGCGSTEFHVLRPNTEVLQGQWLYYLTSWSAFRKDAERHMTGSAGQKRVPKAYLEKYELQIPTLSEQLYQVKSLDRVKAVIELRKRELQSLDDLIKARFVELFGDPVSNPKGWEKKALSEEAEIKIGPFGSLLHKEDYITGGHALVNPSHIVDGKIAPDDKLTISDEKYDELSAYHLRTGDVVMGRRGEMGRCAVVEQPGLLCGTGSLLIRTNGDLSADYIQKIISFPSFKRTIEEMAVGQTMPNLNVPIVSAFQIIKPPKSVQNVHIDRTLPKEERIKSFIRQIKNPYVYKCGDIIVKGTFSDTDETLEDRMEHYLRNR